MIELSSIELSADLVETELIYFGDFGLVQYFLGMMHHDDYATLYLCEQFDLTMESLGWDTVFTGAY